VWDKNKGSGKAGREVGSTAEKIKKKSREKEIEIINSKRKLEAMLSL
jgi:hypothetical protein